MKKLTCVLHLLPLSFPFPPTPSPSCSAWGAGVTCGRRWCFWPTWTTPAPPPRSTRLCPASSAATLRAGAWRSSPWTGTRTTTTKPSSGATARKTTLAPSTTTLPVSVYTAGRWRHLRPRLSPLGPSLVLTLILHSSWVLVYMCVYHPDRPPRGANLLLISELSPLVWEGPGMSQAYSVFIKGMDDWMSLSPVFWGMSEGGSQSDQGSSHSPYLPFLFPLLSLRCAL